MIHRSTNFILSGAIVFCGFAHGAILSPRLAGMTTTVMTAGTNLVPAVIASHRWGVTNFQSWGFVRQSNLDMTVTVNVTNPPAAPKSRIAISWSYPDAVRVSSDLVTWDTNTFQVIASITDTNSGPGRFYQVPIRSATAGCTVSWDASPSPDVVSYNVYFGDSSRNYTSELSTPDRSMFITGLNAGGTYYFAITAVDGTGAESDFSNEVSITFPFPNTSTQISLQ